MKTAGVIAEFNPFHNGHAYMLQEVRRRAGADFVIVVMSGDFVQRGAPAIVDKYVRTEMALDGGADLVIELPYTASTGSAGVFAAGAAAVLEQTGLVDELWFGSEYGRIEPFLFLAELFSEEPEEYSASLREGLGSGMTYPAAQERAVQKYLEKHPEAGIQQETCRHILSGPNNILGLAYCTELKKRHSRIVPRTLRRSGSGYHEKTAAEDAFASAEAIREGVLDGSRRDGAGTISEKLYRQMPASAAELLAAEAAAGGLIKADDFSDMLFYQIARTSGSLSVYDGVSKELANRIREQSRYTASFEELTDLVKSRNYTRTQVSRALIRILLQIRKEDLVRAAEPSLIRVLGFRTGGGLPGILQQTASVPVYMGAGRIPEDEYAGELFAEHLYERMHVKKTGTPFRHARQRRLITR